MSEWMYPCIRCKQSKGEKEVAEIFAHGVYICNDCVEALENKPDNGPATEITIPKIALSDTTTTFEVDYGNTFTNIYDRLEALEKRIEQLES